MEEKRLMKQIAAAESDEEYYVCQYTGIVGGFIGRWLNRDAVARYVAAANASQEKARELRSQLRQLQQERATRATGDAGLR